MAPYEKAAKKINCDEEEISDTIPIMLLLEHTQCGLMDQALVVQQQEEQKDLLLSQDQHNSLPSAYCSHPCEANTAQGQRGGEGGLGCWW